MASAKILSWKTPTAPQRPFLYSAEAGRQPIKQSEFRQALWIGAGLVMAAFGYTACGIADFLSTSGTIAQTSDLF